MGFQRVVELANATPTSVLCEAWGASADDVISAKTAKRSMTISEVGALAEVHGLELLDVLTL
jgi:hypothetical protein